MLQVAVLAVTPGWMRTERVLAYFGCSTDPQYIYGPHNSTAAANLVDCTSTTAAFNSSHSRSDLIVSGTAEAAASSSTAPPAEGLRVWSDVRELSGTESPLYLGRAVVALALDLEGSLAASKAGRVVCVGDLAAKYHFTDVDGRQPARFRL